LADKSSQILLDGLTRAAAEPGGYPLFGQRKTPGLFPATVPARLAAARCKDEGYLHVVKTLARGKKSQEICAITEKGLAYLLTQVSPRKVLEELVGVLRDKERQLSALAQAAQEWQAGLAKTQTLIAEVLRQLLKPQAPSEAAPVSNGALHSSSAADTWLSVAQLHLRRQAQSSVSGDCPLPELYGQAVRCTPSLTVGQFHDGLRRLREQEQIYLHPWTGPLYEMPEPAYALLVGHEVAYYASARN
jgi:hypothetical protein